VYVKGEHNVADLLTKPLEWAVFEAHRKRLLKSHV
jgi:hypothetical protein